MGSCRNNNGRATSHKQGRLGGGEGRRRRGRSGSFALHSAIRTRRIPPGRPSSLRSLPLISLACRKKLREDLVCLRETQLGQKYNRRDALSAFSPSPGLIIYYERQPSAGLHQQFGGLVNYKVLQPRHEPCYKPPEVMSSRDHVSVVTRGELLGVGWGDNYSYY